MSRSNVCFFFFFLQTSSNAHSGRVDKICLMGEKPGAFFSLLSHYIDTHKHLSIHPVFFLYGCCFTHCNVLFFCRLYIYIYIYIVDDKEKKKILCFSLPKISNYCSYPAYNNNNNANEKNEREILLTKKMMEKLFDKKKYMNGTHLSHKHLV